MVGGSKSSLTKTGISGTSGDEKKKRKRLQNRLNQRAFRSRHSQNESTKTTTKKQQYQVDRWHLDEYQAHESSQVPPTEDSPDQDSLVESVPRIDPSFESTCFPLPHDHLLHLIKYNVFRGLCQNKTALETLAIQYGAPESTLGPFSDHKTFPMYSVIIPTAPDRLGFLTPTSLQMSVVHSTWINFIPFPKIREKLIKWEFAFDHSDLVRDLVGDLINLKIFLSTAPATKEDNGDELDTKETGLILWGEPHLAGSWEATPGFLRKWAWAVEGCQELIDSSNYWREVRGERPLKLLTEN